MTKHVLAAALMVSMATSATAQQSPCETDDYLEAAIAHLESHYRSFPEELFTVQLFLKEGFQRNEVTPDGKWGPKTEGAVCTILQTYTEIGGSDGDWGIHRASHTPQFTNWVLKAARANLSDGEVEFPD